MTRRHRYTPRELLKRSLDAMGDAVNELPGRWTLEGRLALNIFCICVVFFALLFGIGYFLARKADVPMDVLVNPFFITCCLFMLSYLLAFAIFVMSRALFTKPIKEMVESTKRLAGGDFSVRIRNEAEGHVVEIDEFVESFNTAASALESTEMMRSGFIDDFSHELKTPIASIKGFAELLQEDDITPEERREYAGIIEREAARLVDLSSDILMLRQVENAGIIDTSKFEQVNIGEQVRSALIRADGKWAEKDIVLDAQIDDAIASCVPAFTERVWSNLVDNAYKFSPDCGTVRVRLSAGDKDGANAALFTIENDGPELTREQLGHIFDRFFQSDSSHATQGCGLGLPMVRGILELHGGSVEVVSAAGHTTFTATLPL